MARRERPSKLRWLAVLMAVAVLGCDPAAETDAGAPDSGFDAGRVVDAGFDAGPTEAELTITPERQDFGDIVIDDVSSSATFTVTNTGGRVSNALGAMIGGGDAGEFSLGADTCTGVMLAAAETCTIAVTFEPTDLNSASATLTATDGASTAIAMLEGNGLGCEPLRISPSPRDFGSTTVGTSTAPTTFTVEWLCSGPSGLLSIVVGGADASQFTLGVDTCTGMSLGLGASCSVEGLYAPTMPGAHAATIEVSVSPGGTRSAAVSGTATTAPAAFQLLPGMQDFGSLVASSCGAGASATIDFTLRNTGGAPTGIITHSFGGPGASEPMVTASSCAGVSLAGGATCTVTVRWVPGSSGSGTPTATLDMTDGTIMATAALTASVGFDGDIMEFSPSGHDFGTSPVGVATTSFGLTVRNVGICPTGPLSVGSFFGSNPDDYAIAPGGDSCTGVVLAPFDTCTIDVQFNPTATGARSAGLRVSGTPGGITTGIVLGTGI